MSEKAAHGDSGKEPVPLERKRSVKVATSTTPTTNGLTVTVRPNDFRVPTFIVLISPPKTFLCSCSSLPDGLPPQTVWIIETQQHGSCYVETKVFHAAWMHIHLLHRSPYDARTQGGIARIRRNQTTDDGIVRTKILFLVDETFPGLASGR